MAFVLLCPDMKTKPMPKVLPDRVQLERNTLRLLCSVLVKPGTRVEICRLLHPSNFLDPQRRAVFEEVQAAGIISSKQLRAMLPQLVKGRGFPDFDLDKLLAPKGQAAVTTVAGLDQDFYFIYKQLGFLIRCCWNIRNERNYVDELAHAAAITELNSAGDLGKQRVVLAQAAVDAGLDLGAALPHDDGAAGDQLASENLDAEPLRIGIAPVFRTA